MFLSSLILTISIVITASLSWFGLLQTMHCSHHADRLYFVSLTRRLNEKDPAPKHLNSICSGSWDLYFSTKSEHSRRKLVQSLNGWKIPRE
tara:strand:- start:1452 stop:1724 length:273 start_codon:yes stop_codon:yes gene_type:complete